MYTASSSFISSVNRHLGCICVLPIVNSATVNFGVRVLGMEFLDIQDQSIVTNHDFNELFFLRTRETPGWQDKEHSVKGIDIPFHRLLIV